MRTLFNRISAVALALGLVFSLAGVESARAESATTLCVPATAGKPVLSGGSEGACKSGKNQTYQAVTLPGPSEFEALEALLPYVHFVEAGIGGKPTIQFAGVNIQIVSGSGATSSAVNGVGNLIIGYSENTGNWPRTGSHNLIMAEENGWISYGGFSNCPERLLAVPTAGCL